MIDDTIAEPATAARPPIKRFLSPADRQAAYAERQRKKLERIKERYRTDPEFRAKRLATSSKANSTRYQTDPEYRARRLEYTRERKRRLREAKRQQISQATAPAGQEEV